MAWLNVCIWWNWIEQASVYDLTQLANWSRNCQKFLQIGIKWDVENLRYSTSGPFPLSVTSSFFPSHPLSSPPVFSPPRSGGPEMLLPESLRFLYCSVVCADLSPTRLNLFQMRDEAFSNLLILIKHSLHCRYLNEPPSGAHRSGWLSVTNSHNRLSSLHGWITLCRPIILLYTSDACTIA